MILRKREKVNSDVKRELIMMLMLVISIIMMLSGFRILLKRQKVDLDIPKISFAEYVQQRKDLLVNEHHLYINGESFNIFIQKYKDEVIKQLAHELNIDQKLLKLEEMGWDKERQGIYMEFEYLGIDIPLIIESRVVESDDNVFYLNIIDAYLAKDKVSIPWSSITLGAYDMLNITELVDLYIKQVLEDENWREKNIEYTLVVGESVFNIE